MVRSRAPWGRVTMAWGFEPGEKLSEAFRRVALEEIAKVREGLSDWERDRDTAIHEARQGFKRLRALVRLAKPQLGVKFDTENRRWRDAGRLLSGSRDIAVLQQTYDTLVAKCGIDLAADRIRRLRSRVAANGAVPSPDDVAENIRRVFDLLDDAELAANRLPWPDSTGALRKGLHKCQARLKKNWRRARETLEADALHSWRKCVKDQAAQLRLLRRALPQGLRVRRNDEKEMGELLGEEHDLWLLAQRLQDRPVPRDLAAIRGLLLREIEKRRTSLRRRAFKKGDALSAEKGTAFASAIGTAWDKASRRKSRARRKANAVGSPERAISPRP